MRCRLRLLIAFVSLLAPPAIAYHIDDHVPVIIDTDMGLDDAVTLAMALQSPGTEVMAIVMCEGAAGRAKGMGNLVRLLHLFNRKDIPIYAPSGGHPAKEPPPFRGFAEQTVRNALPEETTLCHRPFAPDAYTTQGAKTIILALGPLTNLAAALKQEPEIKQGIAEVIVAGSPDVSRSWNAAYDPDALVIVKAFGIPLKFVVRGPAARKPESWRQGPLDIGQGTSIAEGFLNRLLADPAAREHYTESLDSFHDELAFMFYADPGLFAETTKRNVFAPRDRDGLVGLFKNLISYGRQRKPRVAFVEGTLPDTVLREDLRKRKASIIAQNGRDEWFAQLMVSELHEHLGAYSVIGVKMGLRAAELLNAPQHAMNVLSNTAAHPPASCLNDGLIVSTGSTPGRGLFSHVPGSSDSTKVTFSYNGRSVTLDIKDKYRQKIAGEIKTLAEKYTSSNHRYWPEVRRLGLHIWENWHRRDLFEIADAADLPGE